MAYCRKCGKEINEQEARCPECGEWQKNINHHIETKGNIGFAFLGFFIPLVGIILFFVWNKERPKDAKYSLVGALVSFPVVIVVMGVIAAFVVPAVGTIIDNTQKSSVYADALAYEQAAELYCADILCDANQEFTYGDLSDFLLGIDETYYELDSTTTVAYMQNGDVHIQLEAAGTGNYEFDSGMVPSETTRDDSVHEDQN